MGDRHFFLQGSDDSPLVAALHLDLLAAGTPLSVDARDEMAHVVYYGRGETSRDPALHIYLESGTHIWRTLRRVLEWRFGELGRIEDLLDFASGYGRVARHIVSDIPADRVWIAEIDPGAVAFQEATFGVHGLLSTAHPEEFSPGRTFSCVLVSSLFTHLPENRFLAWLERLLSLVREGGLLAFSVHDVSLAPAPAGGADFLFHGASESGSLSPEEYGSTWVTEGYVRRSLERLGHSGAIRIPRGLASYQDLYVVTKPAAPAEAKAPRLADELRGGADGFIVECRVTSARELVIEGWMIDRFTKSAVREVQFYLDEELVGRTDALVERPEVAASFPGDPGVGQGFRAELPLPAPCDLSSTSLRIVALGSDGFVSTLAHGAIESLLLRSALFQRLERGLQIEGLRAEMQREEEHHRALLAAEEALHRQVVLSHQFAVEAFETRIAAMKASRFWKLRDRWFAVKRFLRLTTEE